jgi:hypothetical protein
MIFSALQTLQKKLGVNQDFFFFFFFFFFNKSMPADTRKRRAFPGRILVGNFMGVRSYVVMINHENKFFVSQKQIKEFHLATIARRRKISGEKNMKK